MKKEELQALGLSEEQAGAVLELNGRETGALREKRVRGLLEDELMRLGAGRDAARLMSRSASVDGLEETDDGGLKGADGAAGELKRQYPGLFVRRTAELDPPRSSGGGLTRESLSGMSAREINEHWDEVKALLRTV